jgi:phosphonopyruvate decarboxylase
MIPGREAIDTIRSCRSEQVVVTTMTALGFWPESGDLDFRLLGLMGAAASIGLGIAIARPEKSVWVVDGDGSLMMQLGVLSAVADAAPARYVHIVIDNRIYAISGGQPLPAAETFDWAAASLAAGYRDAATCQTPDELRTALLSPATGPRMVVVSCEPVRPDYPPGSFSIDASQEGSRVRRSLELAGVSRP